MTIQQAILILWVILIILPIIVATTMITKYLKGRNENA